MPVDDAVTIGSLNVHCGLTGGGRPFDVAAAIGRLRADIIAVQEAWWVPGSPDGVEKAAGDMGAELIRAHVRDGASLADLGIAPSTERGTWGIAVLSTLPVTGHESLDLGRAPGDVASRVAQICSVTAPGGWPLRLVNTHLTHRFTSPVQLARLARHLAKSRVPTIIVGDLNMPRVATWVAAGLAGFAPTVRGPTFPAHRPIIQLDHLLAGPGLDCLDSRVLPAVGSDHLPVLASFRGRPAPSPRRPPATAANALTQSRPVRRPRLPPG